MASFLRTRHFPARQDRAIGVRASGHLVSWSGLVPSRKLGNSPTFKLLIGLVTLQKQQKAGKSKQMSRWWNSKERVTQLMLLWGHSEDVWGWHFAHSGGIAGKGCRSLSYPSHTHTAYSYPISDTMEGTLRHIWLWLWLLCERELTCSKPNCYGLDQN